MQSTRLNCMKVPRGHARPALSQKLDVYKTGTMIPCCVTATLRSSLPPSVQWLPGFVLCFTFLCPCNSVTPVMCWFCSTSMLQSQCSGPPEAFPLMWCHLSTQMQHSSTTVEPSPEWAQHAKVSACCPTPLCLVWMRQDTKAVDSLSQTRPV